jgi:hypothetical protein
LFWFGAEFGWVLDALETVGVDCGKGAKKKAVDVSENGGTASGDTILRDEVIEIAEGEVDALGGLEVLRILEEFGGEIFFDGLILAEASVARAEGGIGAHDGESATSTVLKLMHAAGDGVAGIGVSDFFVHFDLLSIIEIGVKGMPLPGHLHDYQKRGVAGSGVHMSMKTNGLSGMILRLAVLPQDSHPRRILAKSKELVRKGFPDLERAEN